MRKFEFALDKDGKAGLYDNITRKINNLKVLSYLYMQQSVVQERIFIVQRK